MKSLTAANFLEFFRDQILKTKRIRIENMLLRVYLFDGRGRPQKQLFLLV